jgi:hypothetical protein
MATVQPEQITATPPAASDGQVDITTRPSGAAVAAMLSIGIGAMAMAIVVGISDASAAFNNGFVHSIGKAWVPGAQGIGPYSGKLTFFLVGWLLSWGVGHLVLRNRDLDLGKWVVVSFALISLGILLIWPPITELIWVH